MGGATCTQGVFSDILIETWYRAGLICSCAAVVPPRECTTDRVQNGLNKIVKMKNKGLHQDLTTCLKISFIVFRGP